jgi:hypothetical protein
MEANLNLPPVSLGKFATGINNTTGTGGTGGKFATSVFDTGGVP